MSNNHLDINTIVYPVSAKAFAEFNRQADDSIRQQVLEQVEFVDTGPYINGN